MLPFNSLNGARRSVRLPTLLGASLLVRLKNSIMLNNYSDWINAILSAGLTAPNESNDVLLV